MTGAMQIKNGKWLAVVAGQIVARNVSRQKALEAVRKRLAERDAKRESERE